MKFGLLYRRPPFHIRKKMRYNLIRGKKYLYRNGASKASLPSLYHKTGILGVIGSKRKKNKNKKRQFKPKWPFLPYKKFIGFQFIQMGISYCDLQRNIGFTESEHFNWAYIQEFIKYAFLRARVNFIKFTQQLSILCVLVIIAGSRFTYFILWLVIHYLVPSPAFKITFFTQRIYYLLDFFSISEC